MRENEYLRLLLKQFSGEITLDESNQLQVWRGQSPENDQIVKDYTRAWEHSAGYSKWIPHNLDVDFAKVQAKIADAEKPAVQILSVNKFFIRAAAAIALLAVATWGFFKISPSADYDALTKASIADKELVKLADGTNVWLRAGGALHYSASFSGKKERRVKLEGEAFFDVQHDPAHPFIIELEHGGNVQVFGTEFDVQQSASATSVLVKSGKVQYSPNEDTKSPLLTAKQKAVFFHNTQRLSIGTVATLNDITWHTGELEFIKTPLSQVVQELEKNYKVNISLSNSDLAVCPYSAILKNQPIKVILDGLALTYHMKVSELGNGNYSLSGGRCK